MHIVQYDPVRKTSKHLLLMMMDYNNETVICLCQNL